MEPITEIIQTFLSLDQYIPHLTQFGPWLYLILFAVAFLETGFVILSLLPADSILFAAGTLAAVGSLDLVWLFAIAFMATLLADSLNYVIGNRAGRRFLIGRLPFTQPKHIVRAENFFMNRGRWAVVLARFIPYIRSLTPFVAGMASMSYPRFLFYNLTGAMLWVSLFVLGGYFFGNIPIVRDNLTLVLMIVLIVTTLPAVFEFGRERRVLAKVRSKSRHGP